MKINKEQVQKIAKLARLSFDNKNLDIMILEMQKMLQFVDKLSEINTEDIQPLTHIHKNTNIYREDISKKSGIKKQILENAPNKNSDYIKVPKVLRKK